MHFGEVKSIATRSFSRPAALAGVSLELWLSIGALTALWTLFVWASGRGFEFADETFDLLYVADPSSYLALTDFGYVWHPLYVALSGSIAWFRLAGLGLLTFCAVLFGVAAMRFDNIRPIGRETRIFGLIALTASAFWQYPTWKATPDYNILNLCGVLVFISGLLFSTRADDARDPRADFLPQRAGYAGLCATGIVVAALSKPTTAVLLVLFGLGWVILLRPQYSRTALAVTAAAAVVMFVLAATLTHGGVLAFADGKLRAWQYVRPSNVSDNAEVFSNSVLGPFSKPGWKIAEALSAACLLFGLSWLWINSLIGPRLARFRAFSYAIALALGGIVLWWRIEDGNAGQIFMGFRLWRLPVAIALVAVSLRVLLLTGFDAERPQRRVWTAAGVVSLLPFAYSFGTDNLLIWHISGAGIFWVGGIILLAGLVPSPRRESLYAGTAFLTGIVCVGLISGVMAAPGRIVQPVWRQNVAVMLGVPAHRFSVDAAAAHYIQGFQRAARDNGFRPGMPIVDLTEFGAGLSFALGARPLGTRPWLIGVGDTNIEAERRAAVRSLAITFAPKQLSEVPVSALRRAWVITGDPAYLSIVQSVLTSRSVEFPQNYRAVAKITRKDLGWTQVLWKPELENN